MAKVSIIIPARNEPYLSKTIDDIFLKAAGRIEVIVILDRYWPDEALSNHENLILIHRGSSLGMRDNINLAARIANGKYLMKCDAHCMFSEGFDKILKKDCEEDWLAIPRRYSLDPEKWSKSDTFVDYLYLTYPYYNDDQYGYGFHGRKMTGTTKGKNGFYEPERLKKDILIDDIMAFQGSCWFMHRDKFFEIDCLDVEHYKNGMHQESIELGMKFWLSGGRVIRNKKAWYAHWHKNISSHYQLSKKEKYRSNDYSADYWMNDKWEKATLPISWFVDKFWPIPGWPENWEKHERT